MTQNTQIVAKLATTSLGRLRNFGVNVHVVDNPEFAGTFRSFLAPTDVILSRWFPGYRTTSLSGKDAEETVAILLSEAMMAEGALDRFRVLLSSPTVPSAVCGALFPRAADPIKARNMLLSEATVRTVVANALPTETDPLLVLAYTHVFLACLAHPAIDVVVSGDERKVVGRTENYVVGPLELRRALLIDALRGVFSDSRVNDAMRAIENSCTPQVLAEVVARMFRDLSRLIPEVMLKVEQLHCVLALVRDYIRQPETLSPGVRARPELSQLANYANMITMATGDVRDVLPDGPAPALMASVTEQKEALAAVLRVLTTAPSMEVVPLVRFAEHFGYIPVTSHDGIRRGGVFYGFNGQATKMQVLDVRESQPGYTVLAEVPPEYVRVSGLAQSVSAALSEVSAHSSINHLIADELGRALSGEGGYLSPIVITNNISSLDVRLLAMAKAEAVGVGNSDEDSSTPATLVYACNPPGEFRMGAYAGSPEVTFLTDPLAVALYTAGREACEATPLPSRPQGLEAAVGHDYVYQGDVRPYLRRRIQREFAFSVPVTTTDRSVVNLRLVTRALSHLLPIQESDGDVSFYATVAEPGFDDELRNLLDVVLVYVAHTDPVISDRARSWLVERLYPLISHPIVANMASRARNEAVFAARLDLRANTAGHRELVLRSQFGVALAILTRFDKLTGAHVRAIVDAVPVSSLTTKAQLALASLPTSGRLADTLRRDGVA